MFTCKLKTTHIKNERRIKLILHEINNVSKNYLFSYWNTHLWFSFWKHDFIFAIGGVLQQIKNKFLEAEIEMWFLLRRGGARLIFRAKKYNVMNKQTDTVALFSGHWQVIIWWKLKFLLGDFWVFRNSQVFRGGKIWDF